MAVVNTKTIRVLDNETINKAGTKGFPLPVGSIINKALLRLEMAFTVGTGTGALADALYRLVEKILLTTSADGVAVNAAGRFLYRRAQPQGGGAPPHADAFAAATATYVWLLPIHFADQLLSIPTKSSLDLRRSKEANIEISMGDVSRLLSTVGTSTIDSLKLSLDLEAVDGELDPILQPEFLPYLVTKSPVDPNANQKIDLEEAADLAIKRIFLFGSDNNSAHYQGAADSAVLKDITIEHSSGFAGLNKQRDDMVQRKNVSDYAFDGGSILTGHYIHDYVLSGDLDDAFMTAGLSDLRVSWTNDTPAGKYVHHGIDGVRILKGA